MSKRPTLVSGTSVAAAIAALALVALPALAADVGSAWQTLTPGGETVCSNGTPYTFYAREKSPTKLLVHLQGGGGCWFGGNCDLRAQPTYDPYTDESDNPTGRSGIFDLENAANPVADFSMVFVSYCTADVHLGDVVRTYESRDESGATRKVEIHHRGLTNGKTALAWAYQRFDAPEQIVVTGSSAGAIAAPFYAGMLADHYPKARISVFADAAGGYHTPKVTEILRTWGTIEVAKGLPQYRGVDTATMDFETLFAVEAARLDGSTFTQYNTHGDAVQLQFLALLGVTGTPLIELIDKNHAEIRDATSNLKVFTEEG
ncbi:MAG: pectin acetylesterase-family hydrolase, partial [Thermoanaerobaculia bacterium]|nr:pectin acetylesterase-family hydrolase [Thermoanaerobaculia bacterium]